MKKVYKLTVLTLLSLVALTGYSRIITCNNNVLSAGQYTSLQAAINATNLGDTVYVTPSPYNYGDILINNRITLIGGGADVNNTQFKYASAVAYIRLDSIYGKTVSGLRLQGITCSQDLRNNGSFSIHNVTIERCALSLNVLGTNWIIKNCRLYNLIVNNNTNVLITNNIFVHDGNCCYANVRVSNNPSVLIANNIFLNPNNYNYYSPWDNVSYANIANNIFFFPGDVNNRCTLCSFTNNITYNSATPIATIPGAANTGGGNKNSVDPKFVNAPYHNSVYSYLEADFSDWRLQASSPGKNAGSDGKDIGLYGGSYPPPYGNNMGIPAVPQMQTLNINTAVVPQGGILNFTFTAKKQP